MKARINYMTLLPQVFCPVLPLLWTEADRCQTRNASRRRNQCLLEGLRVAHENPLGECELLPQHKPPVGHALVPVQHPAVLRRIVAENVGVDVLEVGEMLKC